MINDAISKNHVRKIDDIGDKKRKNEPIMIRNKSVQKQR